MELLGAYIPMDRRQAMVRGIDLPDRTQGTALFADISGFTPLTEALARELGPRRGADAVTRQLNRVYDALIAHVHHYRGSVITFSGDAITCWFDNDEGHRGTACALAMQQTMAHFQALETPSGATIPLFMKAAVASGPVRRFLIGDPNIQRIDVLAGATLDRMAEAGELVGRGEVLVGPQTAAQFGDRVDILEWQSGPVQGKRFGVVGRLTVSVEASPWPELPPEALAEHQLRPWLLPRVYERLQTGQDRFLAELRPAVAFFLKFAGLDYDQDEAAGAKLDRYVRWVQEVLARYEGYLLQVMFGDKGSYLYAAFGAPLAHDDDPQRAIAAALEMRSPPPQMDFITGVQVGISQGRMRAGAYGGAMRQTYGVLGDEVNIAARLMEMAEAGQVLVSQRIADAAAESYRFEGIGRVQVKGKTQPLTLFGVLRVRRPALQRAATIFTAPLVGRGRELAQMGRILASVLGGEGQLLRLEGEAGVGKSHLVAEFVQQALEQDFRVAMGDCQSIGQGGMYYPWRQIFGALFELSQEHLGGEDSVVANAIERQINQVESILHETNPSWLLRLPLLGDLLDLPIPDNATTAAFDPQLRQQALLALAVEIVQTWAQVGPLLLLVEDAHWMDEASQSLTLALSRALARTPVLLVLVHRPPIREDEPLLSDLDRSTGYHHLNLQELSPEGVAALVSQRLQGVPSALALDLVQVQAHGNPFFTKELVDTLRESQGLCRHDGAWTLSKEIFNTLKSAHCLVRDNGGWKLAQDAQLSAVALGIPDSIHGAVLSRLDRLPETHKLTLKVASVVGRAFEFDLLVQAHPLSPGQKVLLEQMGVLEKREFTWLEVPPPRRTYIFKHNITQEVTYETLLEEQLRALHQAVGEVLERLQPDAVERLAYHYSLSGMRDKTLFYLDKAARKAQREYANETALSYYTRALALEERWEWRKGQVEVLHILGRRDEERAALTALEAISATPIFEVAYLWGQYYEALGEYPQAQTAVERALAACQEQGNVIGQVRCLAQLGLIVRRQGDYESAKAWYERALALTKDRQGYLEEEAQAFAQTLSGLGIVHREQGHFDQARVCFERALILCRANGDRWGEAKALNDLCGMSRYQGSLAEALRFCQQALEIWRTVGDRAEEGTSLYNLAQVNAELGDYGRAQGYFSEALAIHQATGNRWEEVNVWMGLGVLYHELGDLSQAQTCLEKGLQLASEIGDQAAQAYLLANFGQVLRDKGDLEAAEKLLSRGLDLAQKQEDRFLVSYFLSYLGLVSLWAGRLRQAIDRASSALAMRQENEWRLMTTGDLTTLAAAHLARGDTDQALTFAGQALAILEECGGEGPESPQQDYFICHQVLAAAGQTERAARALQAAYDLVMARAAKIDDAVLRQSFLERVPVNRDIVRARAGN